MKKQRRGSREPHFVDPDFVEALDENESGRASARRQEKRKTRQFCRQVQRALNVALEDHGACEGMDGLFVEEVSAAPDCGRLLVHVLIRRGIAVNEAMTALHREAPRLRAEVAAAITRKRAPELCFVPAGGEAGEDE
ncbi:ribosome-binding factor A [Paludibaculum fermentans]|uniref:ribosome-binding factor A n=1 Tax=Paludibaculum fermentans TaxID=1473598 RepID=UPI003EB6F44F